MSDKQDASGQSDMPRMQDMPPGLAALIHRSTPQSSAAPVERWNPEFCGNLDIRIASDGTWFYLGSPIGRMALVRLFASVLRKDDDGRTYLVTPVEKIGIEVEDAPFQAVEMAFDGAPDAGGGLMFRTNLGALIRADDRHPLRFELEPGTGGLKGYILVRGRLEARLTRALMHDLVAIASEGKGSDIGMFGVYSCNAFFPICPLDALESFGDS